MAFKGNWEIQVERGYIILPFIGVFQQQKSIRRREREKSKRRVIMEHMIGGKYKLGRKIGSGSFGELYLGTFHIFYAYYMVVFR